MVQTSSSILVLRLSRTHNADGKHYISTTAVVMSELFKVRRNVSFSPLSSTCPHHSHMRLVVTPTVLSFLLFAPCWVPVAPGHSRSLFVALCCPSTVTRASFVSSADHCCCVLVPVSLDCSVGACSLLRLLCHAVLFCLLSLSCQSLYFSVALSFLFGHVILIS